MQIAVIGLGYVGLPLAVEFGKKHKVIGYDIDLKRVEELQSGQDRTCEVSSDELKEAHLLTFTSDTKSISESAVFIVTVPTPVDFDNRPDFSPLINASKTIGGLLKKGDLVIYESTVYPGATEEICVPILESASNLLFNIDFTVGYSPERINPGDKQRQLTNIIKITSGSTPEAAEFVDVLYRSIIKAGTHKAPSIKVAEAAKVIENTQRDANIAIINEFALIFNRLGIDTYDVLNAAGTKWNFMPFKPGLVGGHCIGVDPYYLIQKAQSVGYFPDTLLACRRINNAMGKHVAGEVIKLMIKNGHVIAGAQVLVLGFAFKENCHDLRNTRVIDLIRELENFSVKADVYDPWVDRIEAKHEYDINLLTDMPVSEKYNALILAVAHDEFKNIGIKKLRQLGKDGAIIYDIKGLFSKNEVDGRL